jgi:hypothetical protein
MERMNRDLADGTVAEIASIKAAERRRLATVPTPLVTFGLVNLGGVVATILIGRFHLALYGVPAFALAIWVSGRALARRAHTDGVQIAIRPWALTAAALCIGGIGTSRAGVLLDIDAVSTVGPFLAQAVGLCLLGRWAGSELLLAVSVVLVAGSALTSSLAAGDPAVAIQFAIYGVVLLAAGRSVKMRGQTV